MPKNKQKTNSTQSTDELKNTNLQELADELENTDGVEIVGHVDIANKSVEDVLVVKDTRTTDEQETADDTNKDDNADNKGGQNDTTSLTDTKERIEQGVDDVKEQAQEAKEQVQEIIDDVKQTAKDKLGDAEQAIDDFKDKADTAVQNITDKAQEIAQNVKEQLTDKARIIDDAKDKADELMGGVADKADDMKNKAVQVLDDAKEGLGEQLKQANVSNQGGLGGLLNKLGAYLGSTAKQNKAYHAVNLDQESFDKDAFRQQSAAMSAKLFGAKFATAQSLVGKIAPSASSDSISDFVFDKVAVWARQWAKKDLSRDIRFGKLDQLTDLERDNFAKDIASQNRALAVMGGLAGFFGVKGVVADSVWLTMVSLKAVYQLGLIYDKPLTGDDGAKLAYGMLSGADLSKLQEKQMVLTALALGNTVLTNAQHASLKQELKNAGLKYKAGDSIAKQLDALSKYVDIDKFNFSWLQKLLPVTSVAAGAYYNRELIDEVLGTAMATFRPERPQLLTDNTQKDDQKDSQDT